MAIEQDAIRTRRVRSHRGRQVVGQLEGNGRRPETVDRHKPPHEFGKRAGESDRLAATEGMCDHDDGAADDVSHEQREVDVQQRPRETGVERPAVAVTAEVERHRVIAERRDPRREIIEHAAVVVRAVAQQHGRRRRISPAPQPQLRTIDRDELRTIRLAGDEGAIVTVRDRVECWVIATRQLCVVSDAGDPNPSAVPAFGTYGVRPGQFARMQPMHRHAAYETANVDDAIGAV